MDTIFKFIEEIENRCKDNGIDTSDCYIMFERNQIWFNGSCINNITESKDGKWVCIPVYDDDLSEAYGNYVYSPKCFEIKKKFTTYLSNENMSILTTVWLLYR